MKVPFRQLKSYGCGHYTLANLFNEESYLQDIQEGVASYTHSLNRSLEKRGEPYFLATILCTQSALPLHNRIIDVEIFTYNEEAIKMNGLQETFRPLFVVVKLSVLHHLILVCQSYLDGMLYVVDSLREEVEVMTPEQLLLKYSVQEIMIFSTDQIEIHNSKCNEGEEQSLYCHYENFEHLKP